MYCPSCGTLNDQNNFRCVQCGNILQQGFQQGGGGGGGYSQPYGQQYQEASQATTAIILAAISWAACGPFLSIPAVIIARNEIRGIEAGLRDPNQLSTAKAAFWVGAINAGLSIFVIVAYIGLFVFVGMAGGF